MNWSDLKVIGGPAPDYLGVSIGQPVVRAGQDQCFVVRDVFSSSPEPNSVISYQDLKDGRAGRLRLIPELPAAQGHLVVIASKRFHQAIHALLVDQAKGWSRLDDQSRFAYATTDWLRTWRQECLSAIHSHVRRLLVEFFRFHHARPLESAEELLRNGLYLAQRKSTARRDILVEYGAILAHLDQSRLQAVEEVALRDLQMDQATFKRARSDYVISLNAEAVRLQVFGDSLESTTEPVAEFDLALTL